MNFDNDKIKVAIVLMKGFDGCGVSRFAIEHQKELRRLGHICDVYSYKKKYSRSKAHSDADVIYYSDFTSINFNEYDIFILNSYPKEFNQKEFEHYKNLTCFKVAMMHEIIKGNYGRIKNLWRWLEESDAISSFSNKMDFVTDLNKIIPNSVYFPFKMATSDDEMDKLFEKSQPYEDRRNALIYFGRWTTMKDPSRLFKYKEIDPTYTFEMIGIERSIGAVYDIFNQELCDNSELSFLKSYQEFKDFERDDSKVAVFPPVMRDAALEILSKTKFGCSFYNLKENKINNLGNRMEFTQIELSCVCLPVFDIDWGKHTYDNKTGKTFYELGDNAIYSDKDNLEQSLNEMKNMTKEEYSRRRDNIFELVKRNYGAKENIKDFYKTVLSLKKKGKTATSLWD